MNSAQRGSFMYGGLLDRCRLDLNVGNAKRLLIATDYLEVNSWVTNITMETASPPYQLCFCESNQLRVDCSGQKGLDIQRGQMVKISLVALDQLANAVETSVTAIISPTIRLELGQSPQILMQNCSDLTYNIYSTENTETLILYPDGPCHDAGLARAVVNLTILPCPDAFTQSLSGEMCVCEERLEAHAAECIISDAIYIAKKSGSSFWMSGLYDNNGTYKGLILYKTCPLDYYKGQSVNVTLDDPDVQCDNNHSGLLCGKCINSNYSLLLGSSRCQICSNVYLTLLLPLAAAGVVLVSFLSLLRLTVATGMINGIILYANIVQANKNLFFKSSDRNILTVFIAWWNLDLGFETCFFHGMNAYMQTWLQFAFPLYVWILISLIVITSRYSITVSKLIGHNPIAVLATLLLMSYAKILKIIIEVYSFVYLDYPNDQIKVWLKDANVPYLQSKHLLLTIVTTLVLVFFFLPYTLLLLGHRLYHFTATKRLHWFNNIKPLLDSYHAPYKKHTCYWTGLLLLVRCALYIIFSFNPLGAATKSLLAINITFTSIVILAWFSTLIYRKFFVNLLEASIYLNLMILSALTLAGANTLTSLYILLGAVFVTNLGVLIYHCHLLFTAKLSVWPKLKELKNRLHNAKRANARPNVNTTPAKNSANTPKTVSKTVIDLREPLLED